MNVVRGAANVARISARLFALITALQSADLLAGKLYWTDTTGLAIHRADLDGKNIEDLVIAGLSQPRGIALDLTNDQMFWGDYGRNRVFRADLDGQRVATVVNLTNGVRGVAVDPAGGKLYWTDRDAGAVYRSNLDGTSIQTLATGQNYPYTIRVDAAAGKVYWEDRGTLIIHRANLDGSGLENVVPDLVASPFSVQSSLDLDLVHNHLYMGNGGATSESIIRTDLNGKNRRTILTNIVEIRGLVLDVPADFLYFASRSGDFDAIWRARLDGRDVTRLVTLPLYSVRSIAIDPRVPEPTTLALALSAGGSIAWLLWRECNRPRNGKLARNWPARRAPEARRG